MDKETVIDVGAIAATGLNVLLSSFDIPEDIQIALVKCSPVIRRSFEKVLESIGSSRFSKKEKERIGNTFVAAAKKAAESHSGSESIAPHFESESIDEIIEEILRATTEDSQEQKDRAYGVFIGNFPYQTKFNKSSVYMLARIARELSFDELILLSILYGKAAMNYEAVYTRFLNTGDVNAAEFCHYLMHFRNIGLTVRTFPYSTGSTIGTIRLSSLGEGLCELMELSALAPEESSRMKSVLDMCNKE